jgi:hypothetical protein
MSLDVLTPRGQVSVQYERRAYEIFHKRFPQYEIRLTPKAQPSDSDGIIFDRVGEMRAIIETKCRDMTRAKFETVFSSRWLITNDKLERCRKIAQSMRVPFVGLLYLIPDDDILVQPIYRADGTAATEIEKRWSETQATINGGIARRLNAYVLVKQKEAPVLQAPPVLQREAMPIASEDHTAWLADYAREEARERANA